MTSSGGHRAAPPGAHDVLIAYGFLGVNRIFRCLSLNLLHLGVGRQDLKPQAAKWEFLGGHRQGRPYEEP